MGAISLHAEIHSLLAASLGRFLSWYLLLGENLS